MPRKSDQPATKSDIARLEKNFSRLEKRFDALADDVVQKVMDQMEILLEHRAADLLGVSGDEVKNIRSKQSEHEERLTVVEQKVGLRA